MKITLKQSKQMQVTDRKGNKIKLGKKVINTHEDLVHVVERRINTFNNTVGKNFRKEGFNDLFQEKVETIKTSFGLEQVNSGLEKGKVKLRQYSSEQLVNMYEALNKEMSGNTGSVAKYKKTINKNYVLRETVERVIGKEKFNKIDKKELFIHNFFNRMNDLKKSKEKNYDSEQEMSTLFYDMFPKELDEYAREIANRSEEIKNFLDSHNVGRDRRFRKSRR